MPIQTSPSTGTQKIDKQWLIERLAEMDAASGFIPDPTATAEKSRAMMLAAGVRPEDNILSREILRERYPDEDPDEIAALPDEAE